MKTRILLLCAAIAFAGWSCSDDCDTCSDCNPNTTRVVDTPAEAQDAINEGATTISVTTPLATPASFSIPANYPAGSTLNLSLDANNNDVSVDQSPSGSNQYPTLALSTDDANTVTINTPDMSVIYSGTAQVMTAATAATTLTITKGSTVNDLTITQGGLKLYGTLTTLTNSGTGKMYLAIGPQTDRATISGTLIKESLETSWTNGLILTEGKYPLNYNMTTSSTLNNANVQSWYMPIDKEGYELIGDGALENIVLYGSEYTANGNWGTQNLVTVFADNVSFSNITFKVKDESNKTIEVLGANFKIADCAIVPNDEITLQNQYADGGSLYFNGGAVVSGGGYNSVDGATITNCYFKDATLSVDGLQSGNITGSGNVFDGANYYGKVISTRNWGGVDVSSSTMKIALDVTRFVGLNEYLGTPDASVAGSYAAFTVDYGTLELTNAVLPKADGKYWAMTASGVLKLNGDTYNASNQ